MSNRIAEMLDREDYYGVIVQATRLLLERNHNGVKYAVLVAEIGDDMPAVQIPIIPLRDPDVS